ncbi:MAG: DUF1643 domain-containing protein [Planctomycetes bacterium]|nr:DUF1643 domain-containing protein [Planctomycetota bacterium]
MSAVISDCGKYRYVLRREIGAGDLTVMFLMLNPSTADAELDDPTIRRCKGFAAAAGAKTLLVGNLYGLRSTDPDQLWASPDPVGPDNDLWLTDLASRSDLIVAAWGQNAKSSRVDAVASLIKKPMMCLGTTKSGSPKHPLYVKKDTVLQLLSIK